MVGIFQERKVDLDRPRPCASDCAHVFVTRLLRQQRQQLFRVFVGIDTHCEDLRFVFSEQVRQLSELLNAVWSPMPTIEHQDDGVFLTKLRERNRRSILRFERKIRREVAYVDAFKVGRGKPIAIHRTKSDGQGRIRANKQKKYHDGKRRSPSDRPDSSETFCDIPH